MSNSKAKNCRKMKASNGVKTPLPPISKRFLMDAMDEAKLRQELILDALDKERGKYENISKAQDQGAEENSQIPSHTEENQKNENADNNRSPQQKLDSIDGRRLEILQKMDQLKILKQKLSQQNDNALAMETLQSFKNDFVTLGFVSILEHNPDTWKIRLQRKDYGRPDGFDGLVFYTARGVPILVGRPKAHKDETLRRIAQGADLWFQVEDYQGSRVLLRSSLQRGLKDSKECKQMAANLAARFSDSCYYSFDDNHKKAQHTDRKTKQRIPIMYCDSRKVAKRGSGVGKMNHRKKLGRMYGDPNAVEDLTRKVMKRHDFEVYWCRKS
ncbi:unnamed protein product [Cylindrotheca closterium]|uniref:Uncharacterized protein n=1 Tax=Cylindrotheca closterium TaxID=2856 RepID=A0AAD2JGH1_9STRA|nr:unnamed protein product [Cylindrotheca closterium]